MRTKIVDVSCPIIGCRFQTSNVVAEGIHNSPFILLHHEFPSGKEAPFWGPRCEGSGRIVPMPSLDPISSLDPIPADSYSGDEEDDDPDVEEYPRDERE